MIRWTLLTIALLATALHANADGRRRAVAPASEVALEFTFDAGFRLVGATNPQQASIR